MEEDNNYMVSILCMLFGMGAWILINALFTQMPIIVETAPEGWSLPSYILLLVQFGNIGPIIYVVFRHKRYFFKDSTLISFFLLLGTISIFVLAFTYDKTGVLLGQLHSTYLLLFTFYMSLVGCISSLLFIPFMSTLPEVYLVPYFIGEGLSGFIPSVISLLQGINKNPSCVNTTTEGGTTEDLIVITVYEPPLFSTKIFFCIITGLMILSAISFMYLHYAKRFQNIRINLDEDKEQFDNNAIKSDINTTTDETATKHSARILSQPAYIALLLLQTIINTFSNGILPSIQTYSCLPYGSDAYHWAVNLGQIVSPVTSSLSYFVPLTSVRLLAIGCMVFLLCLFYNMFTAFLSPTPPLINTTAGIILVVAAWTLGSALISYMKLSIAAIFRNRESKALLHYGIVTQVGSVLGSLISFYLVNYSGLLHAAPPDQQCTT